MGPNDQLKESSTLRKVQNEKGEFGKLSVLAVEQAAGYRDPPALLGALATAV